VTLHTNHGDVVVELFADRAEDGRELPRTGASRPAADADPPVTRTTWEDPKAARSRRLAVRGNVFHRVIGTS